MSSQFEQFFSEIEGKLVSSPDLSEREILQEISDENSLSFSSFKRAWERDKARKRNAASLNAIGPTTKKPTIKQLERKFLIWLSQGMDLGNGQAAKLTLDVLKIKHRDYQEVSGGFTPRDYAQSLQEIYGLAHGKNSGKNNSDNSALEAGMPLLPVNESASTKNG